MLSVAEAPRIAALGVIWTLSEEPPSTQNLNLYFLGPSTCKTTDIQHSTSTHQPVANIITINVPLKVHAKS